MQRAHTSPGTVGKCRLWPRSVAHLHFLRAPRGCQASGPWATLCVPRLQLGSTSQVLSMVSHGKGRAHRPPVTGSGKSSRKPLSVNRSLLEGFPRWDISVRRRAPWAPPQALGILEPHRALAEDNLIPGLSTENAKTSCYIKRYSLIMTSAML